MKNAFDIANKALDDIRTAGPDGRDFVVKTVAALICEAQLNALYWVLGCDSAGMTEEKANEIRRKIKEICITRRRTL